MAREKGNRIRIEGWRVSQVPVDPDEVIYQGDLLAFGDATHQATKLTSASAAMFMGISDTSNPIETAGSTEFLTDSKARRVNVVQKGLVEMVLGEAVTVYPYDYLTAGADAQTVLKTGATVNNAVGVVDPQVTAAGRAIALGGAVKMFLRVPARYLTI